MILMLIFLPTLMSPLFKYPHHVLKAWASQEEEVRGQNQRNRSHFIHPTCFSTAEGVERKVTTFWKHLADLVSYSSQTQCCLQHKLHTHVMDVTYPIILPLKICSDACLAAGPHPTMCQMQYKLSSSLCCKHLCYCYVTFSNIINFGVTNLFIGAINKMIWTKKLNMA